MDSLKTKVALVTGASRGIGAATAKALAREGTSVIVNYFSSREAADRVVDDITSTGGRAIAVQADCRNRREVEDMVQRGANELGPIDILVANAGMSVPFKPFADLTYEEFRTKVMGEMDCFFFPIKATLPEMINRRTGCIVGISSTLSRHAVPSFSAHTTAKSAVDGLMKSLALELGPLGIRVFTVAPGLTVTDATSGNPKEQFEMVARMTPLGRVAQPEDIADAVVAVASDHMRFVTGAYIPVCGGALML